MNTFHENICVAINSYFLYCYVNVAALLQLNHIVPPPVNGYVIIITKTNSK